MKSHRPHAKDLRKGRTSSSNQVYLITTVIQNRANVFADLYAGRILINCLKVQHEKGTVENLAFVVMPDHLHWLLTLHSETTLANVIGAVKGSSAYLINNYRQQSAGLDRLVPLWQEGYHDHAVRKEEELVQVARYIVGNPLRKGLVSNMGDYPHWDAKWLL